MTTYLLHEYVSYYSDMILVIPRFYFKYRNLRNGAKRKRKEKKTGKKLKWLNIKCTQNREIIIW